MFFVDTIVLNYEIQIHKEQLASWESNEIRKPNGHFNCSYTFIDKIENGSEIKYRYFPYSFKKSPLLIVEFSVPKILFGNNYTTIKDKQEAIRSINLILKSHLSPINRIEEGIISRIDIYYDHQVGELVPFYIKVLQTLELPYRKTMPYASHGVQYMNRSINSKFYDKEKECGDPNTHGILRHEVTIRSRKIKEYTGKKRPNFDHITEDFQNQVLEEDLKTLHIFGVSIGTADMTYKTLCENYGEYAGTYYYGLIHANTDLSKEILLSSRQSHPRSIERRLQKVIKLGLPPILTESKVPLPPLVIKT